MAVWQKAKNLVYKHKKILLAIGALFLTEYGLGPQLSDQWVPPPPPPPPYYSSEEEKNADPYMLLGLDSNATTKEIKKAYRQLARKMHPDKRPRDGSEGTKQMWSDRFALIGNAKDCLTDGRYCDDLKNFEDLGF